MAEFNNLTPITRREQFLQDIADGTVDKTPITREEWFLAQIAEAVAHGGGGGGLPSYEASDDGKFLGLVQQMVMDGEPPSVAPAWTTVLPSVTDADNGDVLTVVDGAWDKAAPSGGGGLSGIEFSTTDGTTWTCNKTYAELMALDGKVSYVEVQVAGTVNAQNFAYVGSLSTGEGTVARIELLQFAIHSEGSPSDFSYILLVFSVDSSNSVTFNTGNYRVSATLVTPP